MRLRVSTRRGLAMSISSSANSVRVRLIDRVPRCTSRVTGSSVRSPKLSVAASADSSIVVRRSSARIRASSSSSAKGLGR
ncbi:Uncharacterised protein [Mycobacteroides abscessus subsp. abscessus]|nr:Uncharacterised protein [Mycobacteroides abscessus subsp. abscessus]